MADQLQVLYHLSNGATLSELCMSSIYMFCYLQLFT